MTNIMNQLMGRTGAPNLPPPQSITGVAVNVGPNPVQLPIQGVDSTIVNQSNNPATVSAYQTGSGLDPNTSFSLAGNASTLWTHDTAWALSPLGTTLWVAQGNNPYFNPNATVVVPQANSADLLASMPAGSGPQVLGPVTIGQKKYSAILIAFNLFGAVAPTLMQAVVTYSQSPNAPVLVPFTLQTYGFAECIIIPTPYNALGDVISVSCSLPSTPAGTFNSGLYGIQEWDATMRKDGRAPPIGQNIVRAVVSNGPILVAPGASGQRYFIKRIDMMFSATAAAECTLTGTSFGNTVTLADLNIVATPTQNNYQTVQVIFDYGWLNDPGQGLALNSGGGFASARTLIYYDLVY